MKRASKFLPLAILLFLSNQAYAACTIATTSIAFGNYDTLATAGLDSTGSVIVTCDKQAGQPVDVTISISTSSNSGSFNPRQMKNSALPDLLNYNLFTKQNRSTIWGDGTGGTSTVTVKATKQKKATIYGTIPPLQNVSPGVYTDSLTVTITP